MFCFGLVSCVSVSRFSYSLITLHLFQFSLITFLVFNPVFSPVLLSAITCAYVVVDFPVDYY